MPTARLTTTRQFLTDLYLGPFRGHGILIDAPVETPDWSVGDIAVSELPVTEFVPLAIRNYEARVKYHEALDDDSVPSVVPWTGTAVFPAAFGCDVHLYENAPPFPHSLVSTAEEADRIAPPTLEARAFERIFEFGDLVRRELGPDVPLCVPDIQSPFDIAAMIWHKESFFVAMHEHPDAIKRLVEKCRLVLTRFLRAYLQRFGEVNLCHCPVAWAPIEAGVWMSEDEIGSLSNAMFEEFSLPALIAMSEDFGGINIHCCAAADHQYPVLRKIPNLHGLNRVFQEPGPLPAVKAFAGHTVLVNAWHDEQAMHEFLDIAEPDSRYFFSMGSLPLDEAKGLLDRFFARCPR